MAKEKTPSASKQPTTRAGRKLKAAATAKARAAKKQATPPKPVRPGPGRPAYLPLPGQSMLVMVLRANGIDPEDIARELGISRKTLYVHFADELAHGKVRITAKIGARLVEKATKGDNACMFFWLRTQTKGAWSDRAPPGEDRKPSGDLANLTDAELEEIARG